MKFGVYPVRQNVEVQKHMSQDRRILQNSGRDRLIKIRKEFYFDFVGEEVL